MNAVLEGLYQNWDGLAHPQCVAYRRAKSLGLGRAFQASSFNKVDLSTLQNLMLVSRGVRDSVFHPVGGGTFFNVFIDFETNLEILKSKIDFASINSIPMIAILNCINIDACVHFVNKNDSYIDKPIINYHYHHGFECKIDYTRLDFSNESKFMSLIFDPSLIAGFKSIEILGNITLDVNLSNESDSEDEIYYDLQVNIKPFEKQSSPKSLCIERGRGSSTYARPFNLACKNNCSGDIIWERVLYIRGMCINIDHELSMPVSVKIDGNQMKELSNQMPKKVHFSGLPEIPPERKPQVIKKPWR